MANGNFQVPYPINEPVKSYAPGSSEREEVLSVYRELYNKSDLDVPMFIGGEEIRTEHKRPMSLTGYKPKAIITPKKIPYYAGLKKPNYPYR